MIKIAIIKFNKMSIEVKSCYAINCELDELNLECEIYPHFVTSLPYAKGRNSFTITKRIQKLRELALKNGLGWDSSLCRCYKKTDYSEPLSSSQFIMKCNEDCKTEDDSNSKKIILYCKDHEIPIRENEIRLIIQLQKIIAIPSEHNMLIKYLSTKTSESINKKSKNFGKCPGCDTQFKFVEVNRMKLTTNITKDCFKISTTDNNSPPLYGLLAFLVAAEELHAANCYFCQNKDNLNSCCKLFTTYLMYFNNKLQLSDDLLKEYLDDLSGMLKLIEIAKACMYHITIVNADKSELIIYGFCETMDPSSYVKLPEGYGFYIAYSNTSSSIVSRHSSVYIPSSIVSRHSSVYMKVNDTDINSGSVVYVRESPNNIINNTSKSLILNLDNFPALTK